jgi:hypothetical protein
MSDIGRHRIGITPQKHVDMIRLNSQPENGPMVRTCNLFNDLLQAIMHRAYQYLAPALWTPDDMIDNQVDRMLLVLIVHVDSLHEQYKNTRDWAIHPRSKETGLSGPFV